MLGSPSTTSNFDKEQSWIYISSEFKKYVFLDGKNTDQKRVPSYATRHNTRLPRLGVG